jgi:hypothetical protein
MSFDVIRSSAWRESNKKKNTERWGCWKLRKSKRIRIDEKEEDVNKDTL